MLVKYGFSITGRSHNGKGSGCQDFHAVKSLADGRIVAAVADGVGSAANSGDGARLAVETLMSYVEDNLLPESGNEAIEKLLRNAFEKVLGTIEQEAQRTGETLESYDTTLSAVIYDTSGIIYAHSGDGAVIVLTNDGRYVSITSPQKGEDGFSVIPLRFGINTWETGSFEGSPAAVMLMTDGVLEGMCNYLLREGAESLVYVPLAAFFADPVGFRTEETAASSVELIGDLLTCEEPDSDAFYDRLSEIYKEHLGSGEKDVVDQLRKNGFAPAFIRRINDDRTLVGIINTSSAPADREPSYYAEPDWKALRESWDRKAYPALFSNISNAVTEEPELKEKAGKSLPKCGDRKKHRSSQFESAGHEHNRISGQ